MKSLIKIILIGAIIAIIGVFLEIWAIPKLENMPTISDYSDSSKKPKKTEENALRTGTEERPWGGPLAPKDNNGARSKQMKHSEDLMNQ